jgi:hypothetical protein
MSAIFKIYRAATATLEGLVSISAQTWAGIKTFSSGIMVPTGGSGGNTYSGTYTPAANGAHVNVDSVIFYPAQYLRVGNVVTVSGTLDVNATAAAPTDIRMTLPIARNFTKFYHAVGVGGYFVNSSAANNTPVSIQADAAADGVFVSCYATNTGNIGIYYTFTYQVL